MAALPTVWANGSYSGLVARGNFVFSADWKSGRATSFKILSRSSDRCDIHYPGISTARLTDEQGEKTPYTVNAADRIEFDTDKGARYLMSLK